MKYYADKLAAAGWKVDNYLGAGGPMGGQTGYRKADTLILILLIPPSSFQARCHYIVPY